MKVVSTNLAEPKVIEWRGKEYKTGIYKYPTSEPLFLDYADVQKDTVIDRKYHGGIDKACYLFSADYYPHWKNIYPELEWHWGMFGENLTITGMNEQKIRRGDIYKIGTAVVQISEPREPCLKLGAKFGTQTILKQFIKHAHPGTYVRVLDSGHVTVNDRVELIKQSKNPLTVVSFFTHLVSNEENTKVAQQIRSNEAISDEKRKN